MDELGIKSSASLYVSSGNLAQGSGITKQSSEPVTRQEYETQRKHVKIVGQLLQDFDMEKTEEKYRNQNVVEIVLDSNNMRATSTMKVRQRLRQLMGTDVIRLNDKRYMEKLARKLKEEYQKNMDRKEKQLEEAEVERLRKLMLEGIVPMETKKKSKKEKHKGRENQYSLHEQNTSKSVDQKHSVRTDKYKAASHTEDKDEDKLLNKACKDKEVITQIQIIEQKDFEEEDETICNEEDCNIKEDVTRIKSEEHPGKETTKQKQTKSPTTEHHRREAFNKSPGPLPRPTPKTNKYSKVESLFVRQLREAQTVDDMYEIAEKIYNME